MGVRDALIRVRGITQVTQSHDGGGEVAAE